MRPGGSFLLAGANGSGKTTLLRLIAGLHRPTAGTVAVFGEDSVKERLACRRNLTFISHASCLYDGLTPRETLRVWSRLAGGRAARNGFDYLLEEAGLAEHADSMVGGFSAGMRKRLTLLRMRLEGPRLLLLDEPFSALDVEGRHLVAEWIHGYTVGGGTLIIASHDLERTAPLCDRALILERGQLAWAGPAERALDRRGDGA